jgi:hypothetical protein
MPFEIIFLYHWLFAKEFEKTFTKDSTQTNKENELENSTKFGAKASIGAASGAPDTVLCASDTIRCPGRGTSQTGRSWVFLESLRYNSSDCPVSPRSNCQLRPTVNCSEQCKSQKSECTRLSDAARGQRTSTVNRFKPQWSADVARPRQ